MDIINVSYADGAYKVDRPNWEGGKVIPLDEVQTLLLTIEAGVEAFYTATATNALSRDANRAQKRASLALIREQLDKLSAA